MYTSDTGVVLRVAYAPAHPTLRLRLLPALLLLPHCLRRRAASAHTCLLPHLLAPPARVWWFFWLRVRWFIAWFCSLPVCACLRCLVTAVRCHCSVLGTDRWLLRFCLPPAAAAALPPRLLPLLLPPAAATATL
jgi:hypothetical protein